MAAVPAIEHVPKTHDAEALAIIGQSRLIEQLVLGGIDVAIPARKHGIDLIAYVTPRDRSDRFVSAPLHVKASTGKAFSIDNSLETIPALIHVFIWGAGGESTSIFALTHRELASVADSLGYTLSPAFQKGLYPQPQLGAKNIGEALEPFRTSPESWRSKLMGAAG